jgi:hypothetical protein
MGHKHYPHDLPPLPASENGLLQISSKFNDSSMVSPVCAGDAG